MPAPQGPNQLDALLQPSLQGDVRATSIYSVRAGFLVAFFGGPLAAVIFGGMNAHRLGRLAKDSWLFALGAVVLAAFAMMTGHMSATGELAALLGEDMREQRRNLQFASRGLALGFFGIVFLVHRKFYKAAELAGAESPSPWLPGIAASVVGGVISVGFFYLGLVLGQ